MTNTTEPSDRLDVAEEQSVTLEFTRFCELSAVPEGSKRARKINGTMVLVVHTKGKLYAVQNLCSHQDKFLHTGRVRNCRITCPLHGAQFDLATGKATCLPATKPIPTYEVRVVDDWVEVAV
ncbi:Rieske (2Fe-2S) protein [Ketobacter sp.]|uniref:Rieske (2Fe-2S) protein n=1 Tax=Ketobacter sp. TaxID=2083498 RepID=UPI000F2BDB95|nr:non-heme iron oxygenase ferredoxin subunit [Ketobacter sp.]RLT95679.1 MAG: non-heme iron oxygenase ferredoxin subunit [Ketobacter sp.]